MLWEAGFLLVRFTCYFVRHILVVGHVIQAVACMEQKGQVSGMTTFPMISYREFDRWLEQGQVDQLVDLREPGCMSRTGSGAA